MHAQRGELAQQGVRGLAEVLGRGSGVSAFRTRVARVVLGVEDEHSARRAVGDEVRDEPAGELRASLDVGQVEVSILNAGTREGLAGAVMAGFVERGFRAGSSGNAPAGTDVAKVQIWAADKRDPAVELVRAALPTPAPVVDTDYDAPGVVVVVGNAFGELRSGATSITAKQEGTACAP